MPFVTAAIALLFPLLPMAFVMVAAICACLFFGCFIDVVLL